MNVLYYFFSLICCSLLGDYGSCIVAKYQNDANECSIDILD